MILSDLFRLPVTADGQKVGYVVDARFELDGTGLNGVGDARLVGFIVSRRVRDSFLGYERTSVTSPWLIARFLGWRHRGAFLVAWEDIDVLGRDAVVLRRGYERRDVGLGDQH
jgi:hypothetical protein